MGVELKELLKQVTGNEIKLVAGQKGLNAMVDWVHMVDNTQIADFLQGGEMAFTTGIGINEDMTLFQLVERVYANHASGIVINVGPYIEEISQEVIAFGDAHDFPIFAVPWRVHMADIMRMFSFIIMTADQKELELASAFRNALYATAQDESYVHVLMQKGYFTEWNYDVCVIDICDHLEDEQGLVFYQSILHDRLEKFMKMIEREVRYLKYDTAALLDNEKIVLVFADSKEGESKKVVEDACRHLTGYLKKDEVFFASIGNTAPNIRSLTRSYAMAGKVLKLSKTEGIEGTVRSYEDLGIYKLLLQITDQQCLDDYYVDTIRPLEEYDRLSGSNLVETISCYMECNGSVQDTAECLFVHRNTVNYKIKKIESILDVNMTSFEIRNQIIIGLMVAKIRQSDRMDKTAVSKNGQDLSKQVVRQHNIL